MNHTSVRSRVAAAFSTTAIAAAMLVGGVASQAHANDVGFSVDDFAGNAMGERELLQPEPFSCDLTDGTDLTVAGGTMVVDVRAPDSRGCNVASAQIRWTAPTTVDITQGGADRIILNYRDVESASGQGVNFGLVVEDVDGNVATVGGLNRNVGAAGDFLTIRYEPAYEGDASFLSNANNIDKTRVKTITLSVAATTNHENVSVTFDGIGANVGEPAYQAPGIASEAAYGFPASQNTTHTFDVTGFPAPDVTITDTPAWMTASTSKGTFATTVTLTGDPGATYGETTINVHADVANALTDQAGIRIVTASPVTVAYEPATAIVGQAGPLVLGSATGTPEVAVLGTPTGLPAGTALAMAGDDVVLTGTPTEGGLYELVAQVGNEWEQATFARSLVVGAPADIDAINDLVLLRGEHIDAISLEATGYPVPEFSSTALPAGLTLSSEGVLTGTPTEVGDTSVTVTAGNDFGESQRTFGISVGDAPVVTMPPTADFFVGAGVDLAVTFTSASPSTVAASGLPAGLSLDTSGETPRVAGTPTLPDGTDESQGTAELTVFNEFGESVHTISWTVLRPQSPVIELAGEVRVTLGGAVDVPVSITSVPGSSVTVDHLPAGLQWIPNSDGGRIVGTPESAGSFSVTVTADNGVQAPVTETLVVVVELPTITVNLGASTVTAGQPITVTATGFQPGETVEVWLYSEPVLLTDAFADGAGDLTAVVTIPAATPAGEHTLVVTGASGATGESALTVLAASPSDEPGEPGDTESPAVGRAEGGAGEPRLSSTGADPVALLAAGVLTLLTGATLLIARRRVR